MVGGAEGRVFMAADRLLSVSSPRTELLGCYSDQDFLAKLHCVRQAFEVGVPTDAWGWRARCLLSPF